MKKKLYRAVSIILTVLLLFTQISVGVSALNFNGTASSGGDGSSTTASTGGYAISSMLTVNSNRAVGYRFTIIDAAGNSKKNSKDVFRKSSETAFGQNYSSFHKFNSKFPKTYYLKNYTSGSYSTSATTANVCHDVDMSLTLPEDTTGLKAWCTNANMGVVLNYLWGITVSTLESNAWAVLIEPIFPVKIEGTYHSLTVTEIGVYGTAKFGSGSNGGSSSNSNSWGFISNYTNRYMPNSLRLTSAYAGIPAAAYISSRISFGTIVTQGYGAAVVYGEYLTQAPEIVATTYYQESYDGFNVYIQTKKATSLVADVWTQKNGTDDTKRYTISSVNNTINDTNYNWHFYIPKSNHNGEIGYYNIKLTATASSGKTAIKTVGYQPPVVTAAIAENTESQGFYVYANTESATKLGMNVWTEQNGADDMIWSYCTQESNTVNGITYSWVCFIPFSQHNLETGKYLIDLYVGNNYSELLYSMQISYKPNRTAQLRIDCCEAYDGELYEYYYRYGVSYGPQFDNFILDRWYPTVGNKIWFSIFFYADIGNELVRETIWINNQSSPIVREGWYRSMEFYEFKYNDGTVKDDCQGYTISAKIDLIDENGNVTQAGDVYTFYIPVRPFSYGYDVSILSITGNYFGNARDYVPVYSGQRIYPNYEFKGTADWWDYFNFYTSLYYYGDDVYVNAALEQLNSEYDYIGLNKGAKKNLPYFCESRLFPFTVPKVAGEYAEINFNMRAYWVKQVDTLLSLMNYSIPIIEADAEIYDIQLVDSNGYILDKNKLSPGQTVTLMYYYRNNSECTIYVNGYNYDESQISGIFEIPPYSAVIVEGARFTVPDDNEFTLWGGVYYEAAGIYNTEYEANPYNNEYRITCKTVSSLKIEPIMPNMAYREKTDVITSFWVINDSSAQFTTENPVTVNLKVYDQNNNLIVDTSNTNVVIPAKDKNLVYFKWRVPDGVTSGVKIYAEIVGLGKEAAEYEWYTSTYTIYSTPDTKYEAKKPNGFSVPQIPTQFSASSFWWEYFYENGTFVKKHFGVETQGSDYIKLLVNDPYSNRDATAIKSGYPISVEFRYLLKAADGYNKPDKSSYTEPQYIVAKFPEYKYFTSANKCNTLVNMSGWIFRDSGYLPVHFIPIYYPDGDYYVSFTISDIWTPSGCIYAEELSQKLTINGSAYNDWHLQRR